MSKRLSSEDCHAVDLLLERPEANGNGALVDMVFARPIKPKFEARLDAVETILSVLEKMPAPEPPKDLVARTLAAIEEGQIEPRAKHPRPTSHKPGATRHA